MSGGLSLASLGSTPQTAPTTPQYPPRQCHSTLPSEGDPFGVTVPSCRLRAGTAIPTPITIAISATRASCFMTRSEIRIGGRNCDPNGEGGELVHEASSFWNRLKA